MAREVIAIEGRLCIKEEPQKHRSSSTGPIRDTRPFIKTNIFKGEEVEISRINRTTCKLYKVRMDAWEYHRFLKSQKLDTSILKNAGLTRAEIDFVVKNIIIGEKR